MEEVEPTELRDRGVEQRDDRLLVGDVELHRGRATAVVGDALGDRRRVVTGEVAHHHRDAFLGEPHRGGRTDAGSAARDDSDLVLESSHGSPLVTSGYFRIAVGRGTPAASQLS